MPRLACLVAGCTATLLLSSSTAEHHGAPERPGAIVADGIERTGLGKTNPPLNPEAAVRWNGIPVPMGEDKGGMTHTTSVAIGDKRYGVEFTELYQSGQDFGGVIMGQYYDKWGMPVYKYDASMPGNKGEVDISTDPDFQSIIKLEDGSLWNLAHFETTPAPLYLNELVTTNGRLKIIRAHAVNTTHVGGIWNPCAGSITPWNTHLGSEEGEPKAKMFSGYLSSYIADDKAGAFARWWGDVGYARADDEWSGQQLLEVGFNPYAYGFAWEATIKGGESGEVHIVKHYAMGRHASEMSYVMPDQKTVYTADDGVNRYFQKFIADTPGDLSSGTTYCAKVVQKSPTDSMAHDSSFDVQWIEMSHADDSTLEMELKKGFTFEDIFIEADPVGWGCPAGFTSINTEEEEDYGGHECLQVNPGYELHASRFETRRYAAMMGCTTEFRKWEGVTFSPSHMRIYTAFSEVAKGMTTNHSQFDKGGKDDIRLKENGCGCVYYMDVDEHYSAYNLKPLVCGVPMNEDANGNACQLDAIANPDNVAMMERYNQLIIAEDTGDHENNVMWIFDFQSESLTRTWSVPLGAEVTGTYYYDDIFGNDYIGTAGQDPDHVAAFYGTLTWNGRKGQESPVWKGIPMARGDAMHQVVTSDAILFEDGVEVNLKFETWARTGDQYGAYKVGQLFDKDMNPIYKQESGGFFPVGPKTDELELSHNPDYTSMLTVDGKLYSIVHFEHPRPCAVYLFELEQHPETGSISILRAEPIDASAVGGIWVPCAGSVTPWNTHMGSEEYEPDARAFFDPSKQDEPYTFWAFYGWMRYFGIYGDPSTPTEALAAGFNPYNYGYLWEATIVGGHAVVSKRYAIGRRANELGYAMPDLRTVYATDDGTNVGFTKFVADKPNDLSAGHLYCAKFTQQNEGEAPAYMARFNVSWIWLTHADDATLDNAIETTSFFDIFEVAEPAAEAPYCDEANGFRSINTGGLGHECLKLKPGMEMFAATLEHRRYSAMMGCTTEGSKWEGITFSKRHQQLYTAISVVRYGMEDQQRKGSPSTSYDMGGPNHMKVEYNPCGCVYAMDVDKEYSATTFNPIVCGNPMAEADEVGNMCDPNGISEPDNVAMIEEYDQLIIGEDTGTHRNDVMWIYDFHTKALTRVFSAPVGSETTSAYWHYDINGHNYVTGVVQHPYGESDTDMVDDLASTGFPGWVGAFLFSGRSGRMLPRLSFEAIDVPEGDDKKKPMSAPSVQIGSQIDYNIFDELWYMGQDFGGVTMGAMLDKDLNPIYEWSDTAPDNKGPPAISDDPDFQSLIELEDGTIWNIAHFETRPATLYLSELVSTNGQLDVVRVMPIDASNVGGIWVPCAGSVTPWKTHLGSEEYEPEAKGFALDPQGLASGYFVPFARYYGPHGHLDPDATTHQELFDAGFNPYQYGWPWEGKIMNGMAKITKHYAMGRMASELSYTMPDGKTVYTTDDGTNRYFQKFVADKYGELGSGEIFCAKFTQTSEDGSAPHDSSFVIQWISLGHATNDVIEMELQKGFKWSDIFTEAQPVDGMCPVGFTSINAHAGQECLKVNPGYELHASRFETRRYAAMMGCTTEWRKWEGITFSPRHQRLYTALSAVERGTEDNHERYDQGGPNHVRMGENYCGCVMYMDVDEFYSATNMMPLVCGIPMDKDKDGNECQLDGIANPDNVAMIEKYDQLLIGEDTSDHENNIVWVYDFYSMSLSRIFSVPLEAETTSPYYYPNIAGNDYITVVGQHPDMEHKAAFLGVIKLSTNMGKRESPVWENIPMPRGDDVHKLVTSDMLSYGGFKGHIPFTTLARTGDKWGENVIGRVLDKDGNVVYETDENGMPTDKELISNNPDFSSIMEVDGKLYMMVHFEAPRPCAVYLFELTQSDGHLSIVKAEPVDAWNMYGVWIPCAGSVTPWNTHLGSEEYEPDARSFFEYKYAMEPYGFWGFGGWMRYFGIYGPTLTPPEALAAGFNPYRYGYLWEGTVEGGHGKLTKRYAIGRRANELGYVMPDYKTLYATDDGTNVVLTKFVADRAGDLSAGHLYCARFWQQNEGEAPAYAAMFNVTWIWLAHTYDSAIDNAIDGLNFTDIFEIGDADNCDTGNGFMPINQGGFGPECLKLKPGMEMLAASLEHRRYSAMMGCTTEGSKWEGISFSKRHQQLYTAISVVRYGMEDQKRKGSPSMNYDQNGPNHMKIEYNPCGCVYAMDVDKDYDITTFNPLVCGNPMTHRDENNNLCDPNGISEPDNVAFVPEHNQLIIGEDTGTHRNDAMWIYDMVTKGITRIMTSPVGSETTSPYWHNNLNGWSYITGHVQHPYGESDRDLVDDEASTGIDGWIGYFGPFAATQTAVRNTLKTPVTMNLQSRTVMPAIYDTPDGSFTSDMSKWLYFPKGSDWSHAFPGVEKVWEDDNVVFALGQNKIVNIVDIADPEMPVITGALTLEYTGTDIASCGDWLAIATEGMTKQDEGYVYLYTLVGRGRVSENFVRVGTIGSLPDQISWTKDCSMIVAAIEGEGAGVVDGTDAMFNNPEGGVTLIDMTSGTPMPEFLSFKDFGVNDPMMTEKLLKDGVRWSLSPQTMKWIFDDNDGTMFNDGDTLNNGFTIHLDPEQATFSRDLEPEYIAISYDQSTAWVVLQENSAFATVDLKEKKIVSVNGIGFKEWKNTRNGLDPDDKDRIDLQMWDIKGMHMPDTIKSYVAADGLEYIVTANEGDAKEYFFGDGDTLWAEEFRGKDFSSIFGGAASLGADYSAESMIMESDLATDGSLDRLKFGLFDGFGPMGSQANGSVSGAPVYNDLYTFGGRSFSIICPRTWEVVYDSGSMLEQIHKEMYPDIFNSEADAGEDGFAAYFDDIDSRSDAKGPEPESVAIGSVCGKTVAFIGNERTSTIFAFDVSNPYKVKLDSHISVAGNPHLSAMDAFNAGGEAYGDWDPEGMIFDAKTRNLIVGGAVSGTVSVFKTEGWPSCAEEKFGQEVCAPGCLEYMVGDGVCNPMCMTKSCHFDDHDCGETYMAEMHAGQFGQLARPVMALQEASMTMLPSPYALFDQAMKFLSMYDLDKSGTLDKDEAYEAGMSSKEFDMLSMETAGVTVASLASALSMVPQLLGASSYSMDHDDMDVPPELLLVILGGDREAVDADAYPFGDILMGVDANMDGEVTAVEFAMASRMASDRMESCGSNGYQNIMQSAEFHVAIPSTGMNGTTCTWLVLPPIHYMNMEMEMEDDYAMRSKTTRSSSTLRSATEGAKTSSKAKSSKARTPQSKATKATSSKQTVEQMKKAAIKAEMATKPEMKNVGKQTSARVAQLRKDVSDRKARESPKLRGGHEQGDKLGFMVTLKRTVAGTEFDATEFHDFCGGVLITADTVLTAARCVKEGEIDTQPSQTRVMVEDAMLEVVEIKTHPASAMGSDLALLKLERLVETHPAQLMAGEMHAMDGEETCAMKEDLFFDGWEEILPITGDLCNQYYQDITGVPNVVREGQLCTFHASGLPMKPGMRETPHMNLAGHLPNFLFECPADRTVVNTLPGDALLYEEDGQMVVAGILHHFTSPVCYNVLNAGLPTVFSAVDHSAMQWLLASVPGLGMHLEVPMEVSFDNVMLPPGATLEVYAGAGMSGHLVGNMSAAACESDDFSDMGYGAMTVVLKVPPMTTMGGFNMEVDIDRKYSSCMVDIDITRVLELKEEGNAMHGGLRAKAYSMWMCARSWDAEEQMRCGFGPDEWACFRYQTSTKKFMFWGPNSELQLVKGDGLTSAYYESLEELEFKWLMMGVDMNADMHEDINMDEHEDDDMPMIDSGYSVY